MKRAKAKAKQESASRKSIAGCEMRSREIMLEIHSLIHSLIKLVLCVIASLAMSQVASRAVGFSV